MRAAIREFVNKKPQWVFFLAISAFYLSFTPGTIKGMGYNLENIIAADQLETQMADMILDRPLKPVEWPRHGFLELLFMLPFVLASKLLFGDSLDWIGLVMVVQPILFTSLSLVVTFLWVRRLTGSLALSYALSLTAGVGTMLWPYAYVGLETTQSFFVISSAYLALAAEKRLSLSRLLIFGFACGAAISVKTNGVFLTPAVVYLIDCGFFRGHKSWADTLRTDALRMILVLATAASIYFANRHYSSRYWDSYGGGSGYFFSLLADSPARMAFQLFSYFGSVNKSLLLYAPVTALGLFTLPRAYRCDPRIVIFSVLTLAGMAGGFSLTYLWADETWGPRYLHEAILPLTICFAAARSGQGCPRSQEFRWRREAPLLAAAVLGVVISFLGSFFYYGRLHIAAIQVSQPALESLQHDPRMNHIEFNARLLKIWVRGRLGAADNPDYWPSRYNWWFKKPADAAEEKSFDLRMLATPLPIVAKGWESTLPVSLNQYRAARAALICALLFSLGLFVCLGLYCRTPVKL
jgi:hypothetical protein